jgi:hypothetical protein
MAEFIPIPTSDTYSADADLDNASGDDDVDVYADLNSNGDATEIAARRAWARGKAYRWINSKLRGAGLTAPATAETFSEFELLADIEAERAVAILYFGRGKNQQQSPEGMDGAMQVHFDNAEKELDRIISVVTVNATEVSGGIDGIAVIGCPTTRACLPYGGCGVIL